MDGRRHSVDIPISKTLVALRRVRSLRDPSTNSLSKFSALIDSLNWDVNSCNGISLRFENGCQEGKDGFVESKTLGTCGEEETVKDAEFLDGHSGLTLRKNSSSMESSGSIPEEMENEQGINESKFKSERHNGELRNKGLELACISPSNHHLEGGDSNQEPVTRSLSLRGKYHAAFKQKSRHKNCMSSPGSIGDIGSRVGSPYPCPIDSALDGSTRSTSLFANEDADIVDQNYDGCTISCCWSRTPRLRNSHALFDEEDYPLMSQEIGEADLSGQSRRWKNVTHEIVPFLESPRSLSQKFRPKSFNDLIGQTFVARSLMGAISKGRITSLYVFHGPRGTGKTSASRIFAAALNCLSHEEHRPCGLCQECVLCFNGKSRAIKELDPVKINHGNKIRSLIKSAAAYPVSSRFKVFIVEECQLLKEETWATLLSSLDGLSRHAVFLMITPDLHKLPRSAVALSQRYHFPKIKDVDIANRLEKICVEEGLEFDQVALEFIAAKSNGSLRDAEMMLDQLSLLNKRITLSLAYELIGTVSDDELLDLLDLALSADTSNTVKRARELMRSRIDPMQLISQLANIIMDILAGKGQEENSHVRRKFLGRHASEVDLQKLRHALNVLSESEKQLRTCKNQTTWLTVALLQLNSVDISLSDTRESRLCLGPGNLRDGDCCSTSSQGEKSKHLMTCDFSSDDGLRKMGQGHGGTLESIWIKASEICQSNTLKSFMRKRGKLSSVCVKDGLAVVDLEFYHPDYVSKAEKSWKLIASSLQSVLGCNVEIRINLAPNASAASCAKMKRLSFSLFGCSRRKHCKSQSVTESGSDKSDASNLTSERAMLGDRPMDTCSSGCGPHCSWHRKEPVSTIRNSEGNALSIGTITPHRLSQDGLLSESGFWMDSSRDGSRIPKCKVLTVQEPVVQPNCFSKTVRLHKKLLSSDSTEMKARLKMPPQDHITVPLPREASFNTYICTDYPYVLCDRSRNDDNISRQEDGRPMDRTKVHCWRTPQFTAKKGWDLKHRSHTSQIVQWVLPCAAFK
ncbi:hypothetical protein Ancab_035703 [Ancistrocladus abbreviatus]